MTKKYPNTPYWPYSPTPGEDAPAVEPSCFVDREVVITEKLGGEDIYAVHSIEYGPVAEDRTFYAFALRNEGDEFAAFTDLERYARHRAIPVVPVLFRGRFPSVDAIRRFIVAAHAEPSALGGEREGVVLRVEEGFAVRDFAKSVCKSVRAGHVQTTTHWRRNWRPCPTIPAVG